jgi:hypothetical protein
MTNAKKKITKKANKKVTRKLAKKTGAKSGAQGEAASRQIDRYIAGLPDWRGKTLAGIRKIILVTDPGIIEEWKWMGSPVWSHTGILAVGNAHKEKVKLTFQQGAHLPDPHKLFNAGLGGNQWRAIDLHEDDAINESHFRDLIRAAIAYNISKSQES